jgi:hypothetical protein
MGHCWGGGRFGLEYRDEEEREEGWREEGIKGNARIRLAFTRLGFPRFHSIPSSLLPSIPPLLLILLLISVSLS